VYLDKLLSALTTVFEDIPQAAVNMMRVLRVSQSTSAVSLATLIAAVTTTVVLLHRACSNSLKKVRTDSQEEGRRKFEK
jgi:hypothetical protein